MPENILGRSGLSIAIVGAGAAGITAAHYLSRRHRVDLFESGPKLGGHVHTAIAKDDQGQDLPVDMGFIVFNDRTYPNFIRLLGELGVQHAPTDMSFSYAMPGKGFAYSTSGINGFFATRKMLLKPWYWGFLRAIPSFFQDVNADLASGSLGAGTLGDYLSQGGYPKTLGDYFVIPMVRAIWSAESSDAEAFPMARFADFFSNHGLLSLRDRPQWFYIPGGSNTYVKRFAESFAGQVVTGTPVIAVRRTTKGAELTVAGEVRRYDAVVLACHADTALDLLQDPDDLEIECLSPWRYAPNHVVLHTDETRLPENRRAWASWNVVAEGEDQDQRVNVHYWMNRLQRLNTAKPHLVSLNPRAALSPEAILEQIKLDHPQYSIESVAMQPRLGELNGRNRTFFCGSYHGNGFHEDAVVSALRVCKELGVKV